MLLSLYLSTAEWHSIRTKGCTKRPADWTSLLTDYIRRELVHIGPISSKSKHTELSGLYMHGEEVERVESCKFFGVLGWPHLEYLHLSSGGEGPRETLLPREAKARSPPSTPADQLLSVSDRKPPDLLLHSVSPAAQHGTGRTCRGWWGQAERVIGTTPPPLRDIYTGWLQKKASCISRTPLTLDITCSPPSPLGRDGPPDRDLSELSPRKQLLSPCVRKSDSVQFTDGDYAII